MGTSWAGECTGCFRNPAGLQLPVNLPNITDHYNARVYIALLATAER